MFAGIHRRYDRDGLYSEESGEALETFVMLDDQLTQTDDDRIAWMRGLLARAAKASQVIVRTCHPLDYQSESPRHLVDLSENLARTDTTTDPSPR